MKKIRINIFYQFTDLLIMYSLLHHARIFALGEKFRFRNLPSRGCLTIDTDMFRRQEDGRRSIMYAYSENCLMAFLPGIIISTSMRDVVQ